MFPPYRWAASPSSRWSDSRKVKWTITGDISHSNVIELMHAPESTAQVGGDMEVKRESSHFLFGNYYYYCGVFL
jgi:hypothetical protein